MFCSLANRFKTFSSFEQRKEIECCGIICRQFYNNQVYILVVKGSTSNKWSLPKGYKYNHETDKECAIRETYEETGIHIELDESSVRVPMGRNVYFIMDFNIDRDSYFRKRCLSPTVLPAIEQEINNEVIDIRWMTLEQLRKRKEVCNKDIRTLISGKKLWFITKIFEE